MSKNPLTQFANEGEEMVTMVNEISIGTDGWAQIAPFGDYVGIAVKPDGKGGFTKEKAIQRLDKLSVTEMVNEYQNASRGVSGFFKKRPVFEGHPDFLIGGDQYPNKAPQGIFYNIEAREDGLYGQPIMTESGEKLLASKKYRALSARWAADYVKTEDGTKIYRPVKFLSAGLTNNPNLPVQMMNEAEPTKTKTTMKKIAAWLTGHGISVADEATEDQVATALAQLDPTIASAKTAVQIANEKTAAEGKVTTLTGEKKKLADDIVTAQTQFANERKLRIESELGHALKDGRITAADKPTWETRLGNEAQFANELKALNALKPMVKTESVLFERNGSKVEIANEGQRRKLVPEIIKEIAKEKGLDTKKDYEQIWQFANERHPALFSAMQHPKVKAR